ncbi:MAG: hypothetical protein AB3N64_03120 [Puniceicoccaceae bacterium]
MNRFRSICLVAGMLLPVTLFAKEVVEFDWLSDWFKGGPMGPWLIDNGDVAIFGEHNWNPVVSYNYNRWESGTTAHLPELEDYEIWDVSNDGSVFVISREDHLFVKVNDDWQVIEDTSGQWGGLTWLGVHLSGNGEVAVGTDGDKTWIWTEGELRLLDGRAGPPVGISDDGTVVAGVEDPWLPGSNAYRWVNGVYEQIHEPAGGWPGGSRWVTAMSGDGSTLFSHTWIWKYGEIQGFDFGMIDVGLGPRTNEDGTLLVGRYYHHDSDKLDIVILKEEDNWAPTLLSDIPLRQGGQFDQAIQELDAIEVTSLSRDGSVLTGYGWRNDNSWRFYRMELLTVFGRHLVHEGYVDTKQWLGWLQVEYDPWVWCLATQCWFYISEDVAIAEGGWMYAPNMASLEVYPASGYGWSYKLSKWLYVDPSGSGWVYVL